MPKRSLQQRIRALPWQSVLEQLSAQGAVVAGSLLGAEECRSLIRLFEDDAMFRSRVSMERHAFGRGDYAYFAPPLPPLVRELREGLYGELAPTANAWAEALGQPTRYPGRFVRYVEECRRAGQARPTPLLLRYRKGGENRLHRDRYGPLQFPIQGMVVLNRPDEDYRGGEFLLVENRARQQSIGHSFSPKRGELLLFTGGERPVPGKRGMLRAAHRHGMSVLTHGERFALGVIFHNAT